MALFSLLQIAVNVHKRQSLKRTAPRIKEETWDMVS